MDIKSMGLRKSLAVLAVVTAMFTVACETDEDPGTDLGDVDVTEPAGDLGGDTGDTGADTGTDDTMETTTTMGG